ncbi:uncharacterized protein LOC130524739 [Takifugu flavidus]|uniref:uncharacterized protein LOC130524739 n=1 Tax=Takifugu flavidus TaxID=433684 RepID=UPI002544388D|nr:uncharacterized protein LOC130524739 [Takifugu flavidus]
MRDFPALFPCRMTRYRPCLSPFCLPRLFPGQPTCFLPLTTTSASAFLVPVCSPGFDFSAWPRLRCCSSPVCSATSSASSPVSPFLSLLPAVSGTAWFRGFTSFPFGAAFHLCSTHSLSLQPIDFVRARSLKNGLFPVFPCLPEFLFARVLIKVITTVQLSKVLHLGPNCTRHSTIWPNMDPAHSSPPQSHLDQVEGRLQQFEAQLASNAAEARQTASALEQALMSVATQVQQLAVSVSQPAAPVPAPAPPPPVPAPPPGTAPELWNPRALFWGPRGLQSVPHELFNPVCSAALHLYHQSPDWQSMPVGNGRVGEGHAGLFLFPGILCGTS